MSGENVIKNKIKQYEELENTFCHGTGFPKVCKFLSKKSTESPLAKMFFYALKAELSSVLAKKALYNEHDKKKSRSLYISKRYALIGLVELLYMRNAPGYEGDEYGPVCYGYQRDELSSIVIFFDLPGCEQISFHQGFGKEFLDLKVPIYLHKWKPSQTTTLLKLEDAICRNFSEELQLSEESLTEKQKKVILTKISKKSFKNINNMYTGEKALFWQSSKEKQKHLEEDFCGIGCSILRSILSGVGDSNNDYVAYLCSLMIGYESVRLENVISNGKSVFKNLRNVMCTCSEKVPKYIEKIRKKNENDASRLFISHCPENCGSSWKNSMLICGKPVVFFTHKERILKRYSGSGVAEMGDIQEADVESNIDALEEIVLERYGDKIEAFKKMCSVITCANHLNK